jgi:hypothetical protein
MENLFTKAKDKNNHSLTSYLKKKNDEQVKIRKDEEQKKKDHEDWLNRGKISI